MPTALAELHGLRKEHRTAIGAHLNDERSLSNVLIGAGALVLALALGNAHRDAIAGASLAAGTVFTLGSSNLQRPRLLVYQAGVEALRAARAALTDAILSGRAVRVAAPLVGSTWSTAHAGDPQTG